MTPAPLTLTSEEEALYREWEAARGKDGTPLTGAEYQQIVAALIAHNLDQRMRAQTPKRFCAVCGVMVRGFHRGPI